MGNAPSFIYLAPHGWDSIRQRAQQLTSALSQSATVLYVEPVAPSIAGNLRRFARGDLPGPWRGGLTQRGPRLWSFRPPPLLPMTLDFAQMNALGHSLVRPKLREVMARLELADPALVVGWPPAVRLVGELDESLAVFDCMDDFPAFPQAPRRQRFLATVEDELCIRARLITVTSGILANKWQSQHAMVRLVPNGVPDTFIDAAATAQPPPDMRALPEPRLLYIGSISSWLDEALVAQVACMHPEWSFVFIGPIERESRTLRSLPNVHLLGVRPHDALPGYLAGATACTIPFNISPLTRAVNPVKFYEYLAAGKPVASTELPEVERYAELAYVQSPRLSFARACELAVAEGARSDLIEQRVAVARQNTWRRRADDFVAHVAAAREREPARR